MNTLTEPLTERERTVLEMLAAGYDLGDISMAFEPDVERSIAAVDPWCSALHKLGAKNTAHGVALAIRGGHIL